MTAPHHRTISSCLSRTRLAPDQRTDDAPSGPPNASQVVPATLAGATLLSQVSPQFPPAAARPWPLSLTTWLFICESPCKQMSHQPTSSLFHHISAQPPAFCIVALVSHARQSWPRPTFIIAHHTRSFITNEKLLAIKGKEKRGAKGVHGRGSRERRKAEKAKFVFFSFK